MNLNSDLGLQRAQLEAERAVLQQQILDMEQKMDKMYAHILRQRRRPYEQGDQDEELLALSIRNDELIARYYRLVEQIRELDDRLGGQG